MPYDLSGNSKLFPDAIMRFKWEHVTEGSLKSGEKLNVRPNLICDGLADHAVARTQLFMCDQKSDWRNVEQKIYFNGENILLHMGGIGSEINPCAGFAYQMIFFSSGLISLRKRTYIGNVSIMKEFDNGPLPAIGTMKGVGFVRYNVNNDTMVRLEGWTDKEGAWRRAFVVLDDGISFGKNGSRCGGGEDRAAGIWGFPAIIFHNISNSDFDYEDATAREINPGGVFNEAGNRRGKAPPSGGGGGTPLPAWAVT